MGSEKVKGFGQLQTYPRQKPSYIIILLALLSNS
jgi:hypothetical protein